LAYNASNDLAAFLNDHWIPGIVDQIGEMSVLMKLLMRSNGLTNMDADKPGLSKMIVGGEKIKRSVRHTRTASRGSMSGYDVLKVDPNRKFEYALFDWRTYYVALPQSLDEMLAARGPEAVNNWMAANLSVIVADLMDMIGVGLYNSAAVVAAALLADTAQRKGLNGLRELTDTTRSWGSIDSTDYSWWEPGVNNQVLHTLAELSDPTNAKNILKVIRTGINSCTHAGKKPTHVIVPPALFNLIEDYMIYNKITLSNAKRASLGYQYLDYRGVEIVEEHGDFIPDYHMFFLNLSGEGNNQRINLKGRQDAWFKLTDWREPTNQLARVKFLVSQCCLYCDEPRMFGVYTDLGSA